MSQFLFIHFLNGPLRGQSLQLPKGELVCGTTAQSDITLPLDAGVEEFVLHHTDGIVEFHGPAICWVAGRVTDEHVLPLEIPIDIGGCVFVVSQSSVMTEAFTLPEREGSPVPVPQLRTRRAGFAIGVLLFVLVASGVSIGAWQQASPPPVNPVQQVQQWFSHQSYDDLKLMWSADNRVTIQGYYTGQQAIQPLLQRLRHYGIRYQLEAFSEEDLNDTLRYLAVQAGYDNLKISRGNSAGSVNISGAIIADDSWRQFLHALQDVDGLKKWQIESLSLMNTRELLALVKEQKLLGLVSIERHKQLFTITGLLNEQQRAALNKGIDTLTGGQQGHIVFQNMVPASPSDSVFPSPVVSVGGNKAKPFIELADGRRLQPGAKLDNGYEIVAIDAARGIDLLGDDQLLHYTFSF